MGILTMVTLEPSNNIFSFFSVIVFIEKGLSAMIRDLSILNLAARRTGNEPLSRPALFHGIRWAGNPPARTGCHKAEKPLNFHCIRKLRGLVLVVNTCAVRLKKLEESLFVKHDHGSLVRDTNYREPGYEKEKSHDNPPVVEVKKNLVYNY